MFHSNDVIRKEVSRLARMEQRPKSRERIRVVQERPPRARMPHSFEYDFRGSTKVNENGWRPQELQRTRHYYPPPTRREHHSFRLLELSSELQLQRSKRPLARRLEDRSDASPGAALDLHIEIQKAPPEGSRDRGTHRGLSRAWQTREDQVRGAGSSPGAFSPARGACRRSGSTPPPHGGAWTVRGHPPA